MTYTVYIRNRSYFFLYIGALPVSTIGHMNTLCQCFYLGGSLARDRFREWASQNARRRNRSLARRIITTCSYSN